MRGVISSKEDPLAQSYAIGVACRTRFVETPVFAASVRRHLDDETYRAVQLSLLLRLRKARSFRVGRD